jgi:hypothetical protein
MKKVKLIIEDQLAKRAIAEEITPQKEGDQSARSMQLPSHRDNEIKQAKLGLK